MVKIIYTKNNMSTNWKEQEPWISVLGALIDLQAGQATVDQAQEWIHSYVQKSGCFNAYQKDSMRTATFADKMALVYLALGLNGEAGEVAEKVKKVVRDDEGVLTPERREGIIDELGDVLWYLAQLCNELNIDFSEVASRNLKKLADRKERGVLHGDGDKR